LVILAVFIFLISHEIIAGLVWLVSKNSQKGKNSLPQFLIIALIFLANVLLVYLENTKRIEKSSFVISPIILFITSSLLGIWGFRLFLHQKDWFSFQKSGAWIYLGMATISMATVGFIFGTNNDPLIDLFEDFVGISSSKMPELSRYF
jgi:xanthine/uracil permease